MSTILETERLLLRPFTDGDHDAYAAICADAESQGMPPAAYTRLHPAARLSSEQVEILCDWTGDETRRLRRARLENETHRGQ